MKASITTIIAMAIAALIAIVSSSCSIKVDKHDNDEPLKSSTINQKDSFNSISVMCRADVFYTISDTTSIRVEATEEDSQRLKINTENGWLNISFEDDIKSNIMHMDFSNRKPIKVYISAPAVCNVSMLGSGNFECKDTIQNKGNMVIELQGSGDINLSAIKCTKARVNVIGSGDIKIGNLLANETEYSVTGSGDLASNEVNSVNSTLMVMGSGDLKINFKDCGNVKVGVTGSGDIALSGNIQDLSESTTGSGNIKKENLVIGNK